MGIKTGSLRKVIWRLSVMAAVPLSILGLVAGWTIWDRYQKAINAEQRFVETITEFVKRPEWAKQITDIFVLSKAASELRSAVDDDHFFTVILRNMKNIHQQLGDKDDSWRLKANGMIYEVGVNRLQCSDVHRYPSYARQINNVIEHLDASDTECWAIAEHLLGQLTDRCGVNLFARTAKYESRAREAVAMDSLSQNQADLSEVLTAVENIRCYRSRTVSAGGPAKNVTGDIVSIGEWVRPDRWRANTVSRTLTNVIVQIGPIWYLKTGGDDWQKFDSAYGPPKDPLVELIKNARTVTLEGTARIDGQTARVYRFQNLVPGIQSRDGSKAEDKLFYCTLFVATSDGLPRRLVEAEQCEPQVITTAYSDYNSSIWIDAPIK